MPEVRPHHIDYAFELYPDAPPSEFDVRGEPIDLIVGVEPSVGLLDIHRMAFSETAVSPGQIALLLHSFSSISDLDVKPYSDEVAEAIDALLNEGTVFFQNLDRRSKDNIRTSTGNRDTRRAIKELTSWMLQRDTSSDIFNNVKLQPLAEVEAQLSSPYGFDYEASNLNIPALASIFERVSDYDNEPRNFQHEISVFLAENPLLTQALSGKIFSNPKTHWRQYYRYNWRRRSAISRAFVGSRTNFERAMMSQIRFLDRAVKSLHVEIDGEVREFAGDFDDPLFDSPIDGPARFHAEEVAPDEKKSGQQTLYKVTRTKFHPREDLMPALEGIQIDSKEALIGALCIASLTGVKQPMERDVALTYIDRSYLAEQAARRAAVSLFNVLHQIGLHKEIASSRLNQLLDENVES